jgi:hypothetical protein
MPFARGSASTRITVTGYEVILEQLPAYVVAGDYLGFEGTLTVDGRPAPRETVKIKCCRMETPTVCHDVLTLETGHVGEFYDTWRVPHNMACRRYLFYAEHVASGATSTRQLVAVAYPVRISIQAPGRVNRGAEFTISGKLEYEPSPGIWMPLANKVVSVYRDGSKIADVRTMSDGSYSVKTSIQTSGTYTLRAVFEGEIPKYTYAYAGERLYVASLGHTPLLGVAGAVAVALGALAKAKRRV